MRKNEKEFKQNGNILFNFFFKEDRAKLCTVFRFTSLNKKVATQIAIFFQCFKLKYRGAVESFRFPTSAPVG